MTLTRGQVDHFVAEGFVRLDAAFPPQLGEQCRSELWQATGCDPVEPGTWTRPVIRLGDFSTPPFRQAANTPALHEAFDQLVGAGRWIPRISLGTVPVRFPSDADPGDDGWHVEASYAGPAGEYRLNLHSRDRALLLLFLFSYVGPDDAPTSIRVGSHLDVPPLLAAAGDDGREWMDLCRAAVPASARRPVALATGSTGDVYLCHPFLVHAAQPTEGVFRGSWPSRRCTRGRRWISRNRRRPRSPGPWLTRCAAPSTRQTQRRPRPVGSSRPTDSGRP
ncbi:MAG: hypothetical protein JWO98_2903 [Frankiales bacterium]|nr:hypothetical protein [Frankiales bacterium]